MGAMGSSISYAELSDKYSGFISPEADFKINEKDFTNNKANMILNNLNIELTSGFEAGAAVFRIYNVFDMKKMQYKSDELKKYILLGAPVVISLGYANKREEVFHGFIAGVNYLFEEGMAPSVEVTAFDVKGIMMANRYMTQINKKSYGEAVKEILQRTSYDKLKSKGAIKEIKVTDTPDKKASQGGTDKASPETIEMVGESDYEFVVKAAKKFNYEFFVQQGKVLFRKAKSDTSIQTELGIGNGIISYDIGYSITGLVEEMEVRAMDITKGTAISSKKKSSEKISLGSQAKALLSKSSRTYIDPTVFSKEQADLRLASIMENMQYRFGELNCSCIGIPDLQPGRFIKLSSFGQPVDNKFYVTKVVHQYDDKDGYTTKITGCAKCLS